MQVLVVDDDVPTTQAIVNSIRWESLAIDKVLVAYSVTDAFNQYNKYRPQIILCDIEMPDGSGIDLMQRINNINNQSNQSLPNYPYKFIFLTCHSEFSYAKSAIEGHAFGYLTKPFNQIQVETLLAKAVNDIIKQQKMESVRKESLSQEFWRRLAFRELENSLELNTRYADLKIPSFIRAILISIPLSQTEEKWNDDVFLVAFRNLVSLICNQSLSYIRHNCHYALIILPSETSISSIRQLMEKLFNSCKGQFDLSPSIYLDKKVPLLELANSRKRLQDFDLKNVSHRGKVFLSIENKLTENDNQAHLDTDELMQLFVHQKPHAVIAYIGDCLRDLYSKKLLTYEALCSIKLDYQQVLYSFLLENKIKANELSHEKNATSSMMDFLKWVTSSTEKAIAAVKNKNQYSETTRKMIFFINDNCKENPSIKAVADEVCLSPDYAARIFKADTGLTVKEYLNQVKVQKAIKLLRQDSQSIATVAYETGFENSSYFSTVFKQITGLSPSQFIKQREEDTEK